MFQSTHPRGVRRYLLFILTSYPCFNPRTHVGCDLYGLRQLHAAEVSIHAPTWGATKGRYSISETAKFQSTHPRGVRRAQAWLSWGWHRFNPRTHVGCDQAFSRLQALLRCFNPRTHVGCDSWLVGCRHFMLVSIHAPTWGATDRRIEHMSIFGVSIHAPTWGATD